MRHIDNSKRTDRINSMVLNKRTHGTYRINHIASFLQFSNKPGRFTHRTGHNNTRSILFPQTVVLQKNIVSGYRIETQLFVFGTLWVHVIKHIIGTFHYGFRFRHRESFFINIHTYIVQHTAIVTTSSIRQIMFQCIRLDGIQ